jgi:hypothetical protein
VHLLDEELGVRRLKEPVSPEEWVEGPIRFMNGRDNAWFTPPAFTRHL